MREESDCHIDLELINNIDPVVHAPARLMILRYLMAVESVDYVFLMRLTGFSWGNLATHLKKLEETGYVEIEKTYKGKRPQTFIRITEKGKNALRMYKDNFMKILEDFPE